MVYRRARHVAWRTLGDETVVINLVNNRMYGLNESGGRIWEAVADPCEVDALAGLIAPGCRESLSEARPVVEGFLRHLAQEGLIEVERGTGAGAGPAPEGYLAQGFDRPKVSWSEDLATAVGQCPQVPAQNPLCNANPFGS